MKKIINMVASIAHVRSFGEVVFNFIATIFAFLAGYFKVIAMDNKYLFMSVFVVVIGDWLFGTVLAIKNRKWETQKAMKLIYYLCAYYLIVFIVLAIQKGNPAAFFLDETIIVPILIFQTISALKSASLLGVLPRGLLLQILKNIDNYKDKAIEQSNEIITSNTPVNETV